MGARYREPWRADGNGEAAGSLRLAIRTRLSLRHVVLHSRRVGNSGAERDCPGRDGSAGVVGLLSRGRYSRCRWTV